MPTANLTLAILVVVMCGQLNGLISLVDSRAESPAAPRKGREYGEGAVMRNESLALSLLFRGPKEWATAISRNAAQLE